MQKEREREKKKERQRMKAAVGIGDDRGIDRKGLLLPFERVVTFLSGSLVYNQWH